MVDKQKVIKGLELCIADIDCKECPYNYGKITNGDICIDYLLKDCLELIKKGVANKCVN